MPRAAAQDPAHGKQRTLERTVHFDCLTREGRTGRVKTALSAEKRGKDELISAYETDE
jgi:hypothetical protein